MAALTADRNTPSRQGRQYSHPLAANVKIYAGAIVALDAAGNAKPGATALNLVAVGMATERADNTGGAAGAVSVKVERGVFGFASDGSIDRTHIGKTVYLVDDQTLAATDGGGTRSAAGVLDDWDGTTAWLFIGDLAQGLKGDTGAKGASFLTGAGAPAAGTGANGDLYLNLSNGDLYGPKAAGAWGAKVITLTLA